MDNEVHRKIAESIETHLPAYQDLMRRRADIELRLQRAEGEKASVKKSIYDRVCREYKSQLEKLAADIEPVEKEIDKIRGMIQDESKRLDTRASGLEDRLEELSFRQRVGEFNENELEKRREPIESELYDVRGHQDQLHAQMAELDAPLADPDDEADREVEATKAASQETGTAAAPIHDGGTADEKVPAAPEVGIQADTSLPTQAAPTDVKTETDASTNDGMLDFELPQPDMAKTSTDSIDVAPSIGPEASDATASDTPATPDAKKAKSQKKDKPASKGDPDPVDEDDDNGTFDMVNPTEWMKEFETENRRESDGRRSTDTPAVSIPDRDDREPASQSKAPDDHRPASAHSGDGPAVAVEARPEPKPKHTKAKSAPPPQSFPVLIITKGPGAGKKLPLVPMTMTIGREHDNNVELKDPEVARYHARIAYERGKYQLQDLNSSSGTWLNDTRISAAVALSHGDKIRIGGTELMIDFE